MLEKGLIKIGIPMNRIEEISKKLNQYIRELELFNTAFDLVGAESREEIINHHILDCLAPYKNIDNLIYQQQAKTFSQGITTEELQIADIGSGGGLPGIPLAICFPSISFNLVERMTKRCTFLENCVALLGLTNVSIKNTELEKIPQDSINIAVFRAFRPLDKHITKNLLRVLKPGGVLAAYKAKKSKIDEEMEGIGKLVSDWECIPLEVPFLPNVERNLVIINKI